MVHLHFAQPVRWTALCTVMSTSKEVAVWPPCNGALDKDFLEMRNAGVQVSNDFAGGTRSSVLDFPSPLFLAAFVFRNVKPAQSTR